MDRREPDILFEGPCAYAVRNTATDYEIRVFSTNCVRHVSAGRAPSAERAERVCSRLNAYPRQTREFHGLI